MQPLIDSAVTLKEEYGSSVVFIVTNDEATVSESVEAFEDTRVVVATNSKDLQMTFSETKVTIKKIAERPLMIMNVLRQVEDIILGFAVEGLLLPEDKVLCLVNIGNMNAIFFFDVSDIGITQLRSELEGTISIPLLEAILSLCFEIAREGREGRVVGALFVVGDTENVLKYSRQLIINPFKGHSQDELILLNRENWETIKEFAQIDGAFIVDEEGVAVSAGRYVGISWDIYLQGGLGGRHLAAASISKITKAVAITVSTSGAIRIFRKGKMIFKVNAL